MPEWTRSVRGPLAGPVVAGAVCLDPRSRPGWLGRVRDSKQLSARARRELAAAIKDVVPGWGVGWAAVQEIDSVGILQATRLAMRRALSDLAERVGVPVSYVLVDGRDAHHFDCAFETIIGGDASSTSIAAASVVAKVARDAWMETRAAAYPGYGFAANKGYGTPRASGRPAPPRSLRGASLQLCAGPRQRPRGAATGAAAARLLKSAPHRCCSRGRRCYRR